MTANCEILAPAGDREALEAALAAGAEAVYFGLDEGFNARARASNFRAEGLSEVVRQIHLAGARAYLALNTLVFEAELPRVEGLLAKVAQAGVDAVIVQDPGLALLCREVAPEVEIHASTQMTISSPEATKFAETLGVTRVVVPRELSVEEIRKFREGTELELEVFIMGALCMAWSGQCLSSEAWGGRSANRGKCAQACRLPYELVVDREVQPLGDVQYLLSPRDLAGFRAVEELLEIGIHTLKIEGRQKNASFVHHSVQTMKSWRDAVQEGRADLDNLSEELRDLSLVYSRGLSDGFLKGVNHQTLVEGRTPRHQGVYLGTVSKVRKNSVLVTREEQTPDGPPVAPVQLRNGMGVVFYQGDAQEQEQGGPLFDVAETSAGWKLTFGRPGPNLSKVRIGARVHVTSDPKLLVKSVRSPEGRLPISMKLAGELDARLQLSVSFRDYEFQLESDIALQQARKSSLSPDVLKQNLGALGGTPFRLEELESSLPDGLFLPFAQLRELRRSLVARLLGYLEENQAKRVVAGPHLPKLRVGGQEKERGEPYLVALCRNAEQLEAAIEAGVSEVELDWMEMVGLIAPVKRAREAGLRVGLATVRIQKPGEQAYDRRIEKLGPDSVLIRHWAGLMHFLGAKNRPELHGDFSLNVTNSLTAHHLLNLGLDTVTASHDLDKLQLLELLAQIDPRKLAVTVHHHIPTFHTEHCVYSALLSEGRDYRTCGRPCEKHEVSLRDRVDLEHPVIVDVGCRNTVFNAQAQSAAFLVPELVEKGVERFRVEFVRETREEAGNVLQSYQALLSGELEHGEVVQRIGVHEQFGVTRGTMQLLV